MDYEELTEYLAATEKERERTMHPSMMDRGLNITGYLTDKIQEARGIDSEKMRREKILKLDMRIREVSPNSSMLALATVSITNFHYHSCKRQLNKARKCQHHFPIKWKESTSTLKNREPSKSRTLLKLILVRRQSSIPRYAC